MGLIKESLGSDPSTYARYILRECGIIEPPTPVDNILEYLDIRTLEFSEDDIDPESHDPDLKKRLESVCACLRRHGNSRTILLYKRQPIPRKRLGIFHECGHDVIPWHKELDYFCKNEDISSVAHSRFEKEAFKFGTELIMPTQSFFELILGTEPSFNLVRKLGRIHQSSIEATAIKYALSYPGQCALLMLGPFDEGDHETHISRSTNQLGLGLNLKPIQIPFTLSISPLKVRYIAKSRRFPKFIKPGTIIPTDSQTFELWNRRDDKKIEIQALDFGSRSQFTYLAETRYLSQTNSLMLFLWLEDPQLNIELKTGEIYYESSLVREGIL